MRQLRVVVSCLVALVALVVAAEAGAQPGRASAPPSLDWRACGGGFQCATLAVPRSWANPRGARIRLRLIRLPATVPPSRRIGSLLVNYGGPGAAGVASLRVSGALIRRATRGRFDVVSWDPRGVGTSAPVLCPEGNEAYYNADPSTPEGIAAITDAVALRARVCRARYGSYLAAIGTNQVVRDMDAIRRAVGDRSTTFLGLSYGTRVGAVYAQRYPRRVRAMVLDGALPPVSTLREISAGLGLAFERGLHVWLERCGARPDCAFGPDPLAGFDALVARVRAERPAVPSLGGRHLTPGLLNQVLLAGIVNFDGSTELAERFIGQYLRTGDASGLLAFAEIITGRRPDGTYAGNGTETFQLVNCLDWQDRPTAAQVAALVEDAKRSAPRMGAFGVSFAYANAAGCPFPATPVPPPTAARIAPILVVGNNDDPETPLENAQELSRSLPGSRLLVSQSFGHTAFTTSPCVARRAGAYLVSRRLPPVGAVCHDPAPPRRAS